MIKLFAQFVNSEICQKTYKFYALFDNFVTTPEPSAKTGTAKPRDSRYGKRGAKYY